MRVVVFANRGHGTTAVMETLRVGCDVVVVGRPQQPFHRRIYRRVARLWNPFHDPFDAMEHPSKLASFIPSTQLHDLPNMGLNPDLILCCSFHRLVPKAVLDLSPLAVNIHPGLLPKRAGGTPNRWAILEGDEETGVTAHLMTGEFDAGDIVWQARTPIRETEVWGELEHRLTPMVEQAVSFVVRSIREGRTFERRAQVPNKQPSYRGLPADEDPWLLSKSEMRQVCRATLPKACGLNLCKSRLSHRFCGF